MHINEEVIQQKINALFLKNSLPVTSILRLPQQGSNRIYHRVYSNETSYIVTFGDNVKENQAFHHFSDHFHKKGLAVPQVNDRSDDGLIYFQEDFGDTSLLSILEKEGYTPKVFGLFANSLKELAHLQVKGDKGLDYKMTITSKKFGKEAIMADFLYFKYYFLDALQQPYDKELLLQEFSTLSTILANSQHEHFMFRDFQSRNIMVTDERDVHFIDFQGGMKGAVQYDVASLLWQAKAALPKDWKDKLLAIYKTELKSIISKPFEEENFDERYNGYVLIRLLQVMGAYGFRGLFERKAHFLTSIPLGLENLRDFLAETTLLNRFPTLKSVLEICVSPEIYNRFVPTKATEQTPLKVTINSFSFIKNGYPPDPSVNGGGFVFDCRGILNPGRVEEHKTQSGEDEPVKNYLEFNTKMNEFLQSVYSMVDISVEDYLKRDFSSLMVNFGCTGGQHRSVYAANALARHLKNKFGVPVTVTHLNKEGWRR